MADLNPCPFCGSKDVTTHYLPHDKYDHWFFVCCNSCKAIISFDDEEGCVTQFDVLCCYNRRA